MARFRSSCGGGGVSGQNRCIYRKKGVHKREAALKTKNSRFAFKHATDLDHATHELSKTVEFCATTCRVLGVGVLKKAAKNGFR